MQIAMIGWAVWAPTWRRTAPRRSQGGWLRSADAARAALEQKGAESAASLQQLSGNSRLPRVIWLMVPAGAITDSTITSLTLCLRRATPSSRRQFELPRHSAPCGGAWRSARFTMSIPATSGGVWGSPRVYSLMIGGDEAVVERCGRFSRPSRRRRTAAGAGVGAVGSGHYTKMIHNGIEYGLMQPTPRAFPFCSTRASFQARLAPDRRDLAATAAWCVPGC